MGRSRWAASGLLVLGLAVGAAAERAWVTGAPLNLRTGPTTGHRILATLDPGAALEVRERQDDWARVRTAEGREGWLPAAYLSEQAPPAERAAALEAELAGLRGELEATSAERARLAAEREALAGSDEGQRTEIDRLTRENMRLRSGERWFEWITGALILSTGMVLGVILSRLPGRRGRSRLKL